MQKNLIWLPKRSGINRVGLLDYQDALAGHPAYDLVSLLEDARRDTSSDLQTNMINKYISNSDLNREEFLMAYNLLGAQRNIKNYWNFFTFVASRQKIKLYKFNTTCMESFDE